MEENKNYLAERLIDCMEDIVEMLQGDRTATGQYAMTEATKRYSTNVQAEIQCIIDEGKTTLERGCF